MAVFKRRKQNNEKIANSQQPSLPNKPYGQFGPTVPLVQRKETPSKPLPPHQSRSGQSYTSFAQMYGHQKPNSVQAKQQGDVYQHKPRFIQPLSDPNSPFNTPSEPIPRPGIQHQGINLGLSLGLSLQRSPLHPTNGMVIQREVMDAATFNTKTKYTGWGVAGKSYKAIKTALAAYHTTQYQASAEEKLAMLRKIGYLCFRWIAKYLTVDVDPNTGTLSYKHENQGTKNENKKSKTRKDGIIKLQEQVYAEHHRIVASMNSSNQENEDGSEVVRVYQGQGGTADLRKTTLVSHNFTTCTPIVMFNSSTKLGGLFHYATGSLATQSLEMVSMAKYIQPTHVYIYGGSHMDVPSNSTNEDDKKLAELHATNQPAMANFFSFCATNFNSTVVNEQGFAATISIGLEDGKLDVNTGLAHPKATIDLRSLKDEENKDTSDNLPAKFIALTSSEIMYDDLEIAMEQLRYEQEKVESLKMQGDEKFFEMLGDVNHQDDLTEIDMDKMYQGWIDARQKEGVDFSGLKIEDYEKFIIENKNNMTFKDTFEYDYNVFSVC